VKKKNYLGKVLGRVLLIIYSLFLIVPLYMVIITAIKSKAEVYNNPIGLPHVILLSNFKNAIINAKIVQYGMNSIIVTSSSVFLIIVINILCAYGIYKLFNKKLGVFLYSFIMMGLMVPGVGYVSMILLYRKFHLYNNLTGLIVNAVAASVPFAMFILVGFLRSIPKELEEAATIDGCNSLQSLVFVLLPAIKPAVTTVAIFNLIGTWNNLFVPLLLVNKPKLFTIPIGMLAFKGNYSTDYSLMFAGAIVVSLPLLIIYFMFQKNFIESLAGGLKE